MQFATTYDGSGNPTGGSLGINSAFIITSGANPGTLFLNGINQQVGSLASTQAMLTITLGGGGTTGAILTTGGDNTSTTFAGIIAEQTNPGGATNGGVGALSSTGGAIVKIGTGTQTFSGPNLYEGSTTIAGGVLSVTTIADGGVVTTGGNGSVASTTLTVSSTTGLVIGERVQGNGVVFDNSGTVATVTAINAGSITFGRKVPNSTPLFFGFANGLDISSNLASNLIIDGVVASLQYNGTAVASTDRLFQIGRSTDTGVAVGTLDASGSSAVTFSNTGAIAFGLANQADTLVLTGHKHRARTR